MSESTPSGQGGDPAAPLQPGGPVEVRIVPDIPVVFSDGILSQSFAKGITKFYLFRTDIAPNVVGPLRTTVVGQVVMPADAFARTVHFFRHRLRLMIAAGAISQAEVDEIDKTVYDDPVVEKDLGKG
jgi:hypothetical protein